MWLWQVALWGLTLAATVMPRVIARSTATGHINDHPQDPLVCVIIRTYWKHGLGEVSLLQRLIDSLRRQKHHRYENHKIGYIAAEPVSCVLSDGAMCLWFMRPHAYTTFLGGVVNHLNCPPLQVSLHDRAHPSCCTWFDSCERASFHDHPSGGFSLWLE